MPSAATAPTLPEITAAILAAPPPAFTQSPTEEQTLRAYAQAWGGGKNIATLLTELGYPAALSDRVDARLEAAPLELLRRLAGLMGRPLDELVWAAGNVILTAPPPGLGGPRIKPNAVPPPNPGPPPNPPILITTEIGDILFTDTGNRLRIGLP